MSMVLPTIQQICNVAPDLGTKIPKACSCLGPRMGQSYLCSNRELQFPEYQFFLSPNLVCGTGLVESRLLQDSTLLLSALHGKGPRRQTIQEKQPACWRWSGLGLSRFSFLNLSFDVWVWFSALHFSKGLAHADISLDSTDAYKNMPQQSSAMASATTIYHSDTSVFGAIGLCLRSFFGHHSYSTSQSPM